MKKKFDLKAILKYVWIVYGVFSIIIVLYLVDMLICKDILDVSTRYIMNDHWNVTINDKYYEDINLDQFTFDSVSQKDVIVMEATIPDDYEFKQAALCINNKHTALSMYVDGELEYEYGYERYMENKSTGSGYLIINFLDEYKGKNLRLEYFVTENNAFSKFDEVWLCEWENAYRYIITENRIPFFIGSFLVVFGVAMTVLQIFAAVISKKFWNVLLISLFSLCIGLWTLCYYNIVLIFSIPLYSKSLIEYMSLFIAPLPLVAYMDSFVKETEKRWVALVHKILFFGQLVLTVTAIALHSIDLVHAARMIIYFHIFFIVHLVFFVCVLYIRQKKDAKLSGVTTIGSIIVFFCIVYELLSYSLTRYAGYEAVEVKGVSSVGLVIFLGILVVDLYKRVTKSMMEEQEKALLIKRAYTDELTKLYNRAYCSDHMRKLSSDDKSRYIIINFDLNGLKKMNDTYGHMKGDELIYSAAKVIEKTFSDHGVVGRMGGDEFIVIMETAERGLVDQLIKKFHFNIKAANKEDPELGLSISYGYAANWEFEGESFEKIYQVADERMYAYKQKVKKAL